MKKKFFTIIYHSSGHSGTRICFDHMKSKVLDLPTKLERELTKRESTMKRSIVAQSEVMDLLVSVTFEAQNGILEGPKGPKLSFDDTESCSDDFYHSLTGITKPQFNILLNELNMRTSRKMTKRNNLALYLTRIRTGLNLQCLGMLFGCKSRREVSQRIIRVRKHLLKSSLMKDHFGFGQMTREKLIQQHSTQYARSFFGRDASGQCTKPVVIIDGGFSALSLNSKTYLTTSNMFQGLTCTPGRVHVIILFKKGHIQIRKSETWCDP